MEEANEEAKAVDARVEARDVKWSRAQADFIKAGLSLQEYTKLVGDNKKNALALKEIVTSYLDYFSNVADIGELIEEREMSDPDVLAGIKEPREETDEAIEEIDEEGQGMWLDTDNLADLVKKTEMLLDGKVTPENIHAARALCAAAFNEALEVIEEQRMLIVEIKEEEPDDDFSEDDLMGFVKNAEKVIASSEQRLKTVLMADRYVSEVVKNRLS